MRAMLSDMDTRIRWYGWHGESEAPVAARAEARAILARTEPLEWYPGREGAEHLRSSVTTRDYTAYRVAVDCLAEALTAFDAAEDPAAWLRKRQE